VTVAIQRDTDGAPSPGADAILIVDDDPEIRSVVAKLLARIGLATTEAAGGDEALTAVRRNRPSLVLLDVQLPDMSGYELCRELRQELGEELPIIMLSGAKTDALDRSAGLLLGADDFIVKPFDPDELRARVRRLLARSSAARPASPSAQPAHTLTKRELEILRLLASGKTSAQIAHALVLSPKTISTHVQHVLAKLGVHSQAQAVAAAYRDGLITDGAPPR
jgi:DNA-binding NarL/FixJ family response regulator